MRSVCVGSERIGVQEVKRCSKELFTFRSTEA